MNKYTKLYGHHASSHALSNKERIIKEVFVTKNAHKKITENYKINLDKFNTKIDQWYARGQAGTPRYFSYY